MIQRFLERERLPAEEGDSLARLIQDEANVVTCGIVVAEVFQGFRRASSIVEIEPFFRDMEWLTPREPETYFAAAELHRKLRAQGVTVRSIADCLIARLAEEASTLLLAKDRDMAAILGSALCDVAVLRSNPKEVLSRVILSLRESNQRAD